MSTLLSYDCFTEDSYNHWFLSLKVTVREISMNQLELTDLKTAKSFVRTGTLGQRVVDMEQYIHNLTLTSLKISISSKQPTKHTYSMVKQTPFLKTSICWKEHSIMSTRIWPICYYLRWFCKALDTEKKMHAAFWNGRTIHAFCAYQRIAINALF